MNFVGQIFDKNSYFFKKLCVLLKKQTVSWWSLISKSGLKVDSYNIAMQILTYEKLKSVHGLRRGSVQKKQFVSIPIYFKRFLDPTVITTLTNLVHSLTSKKLCVSFGIDFLLFTYTYTLNLSQGYIVNGSQTLCLNSRASIDMFYR